MPDHPFLPVALAAAQRGWYVFPLRPNDKRPAFPDHTVDRCTGSDARCRAAGRHVGWQARATVDPDRIRRGWATAPYGVGISCGPSGLVVLDLDMPKPGQTPPPQWTADGITDGGDVFAVLCERAGQPFPGDTYTVRTGRGGLHLYFRHPYCGEALRNTAGDRGRGLGWLVDTRAHGGYVVAAGSIAADRPYTVLHDTAPALLPGWLADALRPAPMRPAGAVVVELPADRHGAYVRAAVAGTLAKLAEAAEGGRNHALFMAAQTLGQLVAGGALTEDFVTGVLTQQARAIGLTDPEALRTIRSGLTAGARRPRTVAA
jgi:Bifunctional DNA primase/polymerase, N-terminal